MKFKLHSIISVLSFIILMNTTAEAVVTLPAGFSQVLVAGGITMPTTMAAAPDGRFFIAQQNGVMKVLRNDTLLSQPFISLNVNTDGERGLLGVAFDPSFATNHYVYMCYTVPSGLYNNVSRFTASGDTVVPGSEVVIMQLDSLTNNYHGGGHLQFGPDGTLYIAAGENGHPTQSQNLNSYLGKIIRINPDGSVPVNNPFPGPGKQSRIWAYGLRNPFTFAFQPGTGKLFIDDVGEITWEEINDATTGGMNFGWPTAEGMSIDTAFDNPFYTYLHGTASGQGCAITGGTFFNPDTTTYPSIYTDKYFYIDYCGNWIDMITLTNPPTRTNFATNIAYYSVGIMTGPDGNLYFLSRNDEALYKIVYSSNPVPAILNQPQSKLISLGHPVTFSVTASGAATLNYQWEKNTVAIPLANSPDYTIPAVAFSDSGNYRVVVTNGFGSTTSSDAHLSVTANQPPNAVIDTPLTNTLYTAGQTINFHGYASDPEDGTLAASTYQWMIEFHHDTHLHPGPTVGSGSNSGSFTIPNTGEKSANVFYRLYLIVQDSEGMIDSAYVDIHPRTTTLTLATQPSGLTVYLDGQPFTTPYSVLSVEGMYRMFRAPYSSAYGLTQLMFTSWSNGGTMTQTLQTPVNDVTFTANYDSLQLSYSLGPDSTVCIGDVVVLDAGAGYDSYAWTDGSVGRYYNVSTNVSNTFQIGVTVVNSAGLAGNDSVIYTVDICNAVPTLRNENVSIYPVPSGGTINISKFTENYYMNVVDMTGRFLYKDVFTRRGEVKQLQLPSGLYTIQLFSESKSLIIQKTISIVQ